MSARFKIFTYPFIFTCTIAPADVRLIPVGPSYGHHSVWLNGISSDGTAVVGKDFNEGGPRPFRWKADSGSHDLCGDLPGRLEAINCSGAGQTVTAFGAHFAGLTGYRWNETTGWALMELTPTSALSVPYGVSEDGLAIAGLAYTSSGVIVAFRWTETWGYEVLANPPGTVNPQPYAVNSDGSVIAGTVSYEEAYYWTQSRGARLIHANSNPLSIRISPNGQFICGGGGNLASRPWYFERETESLTYLQGINGFAEAQGITDDGAMIVGTANGNLAFIWDAEHGMRPLRDVLATDYGLDVAEWNFTDAIGISGDGRVIAGNGTFQGFNKSWIVQFDTPQPYRGRPRCQGDVNSDGRVSLLDLGLVLSEFQLSGPDLVGDCNGDGVVDALDLNIVTLDQGQRCVRLRSIAIP